jgi:subtilase family serine protease
MLKSIFVRFPATCACVFLLTAGLAAAPAQVQDRIQSRIDPAVTSEIKGNIHPLGTRQRDVGRLSASFKIAQVTMMFNMTDAQRTALNNLLQRQQDPASPDYHRWLTPEEYASRFGVSENDRQQVVSWLQSQGLTVNEIGRNGRFVTFTGSARQIETAFRTSLHQYNVDGETHYANATEPWVPSAFANLVLGFRGLNNFRLKARPNHRAVMNTPQFTSSVTGSHFLSPSDFATIYDLNPLYANGINGSGQSIIIAGQTDIDLNDIRAFRTASGLPANDPVVVLVPGLGDPGTSRDDLPEADLDLEWAGAVAPNARLIYVNSTNVLDSLQYAIDQNLAPVASISYGDCEPNFTSQDVNLLLSITQQANSQGMTVVAASGDSGAADCDGSSETVARLGLAVDLPAALPSVTGLGGSEFREVSTASWSSTNTSSSGSALSYIPEGAWNDTSTGGGLASGGGGRSIYFSKPSWQSFSGVPNDAARDVPDVSLNASPDHDGYLMCSAGSCTNGFRSANGSLFVAGGTSAAAPTFAAIVALINQKTNTPQGNINPLLYSLAASAPSAFHDITAGSNQVPCAAGSAGCGASGVIGYSAGPGYDQATGLGSVDALNLVTAWPMSQSSSGQTTGGDPTSTGPSSTPSSGSGSSTTSTPTSAPLPIGVVEQGNLQSGYVVITPDTNTVAPAPTVTFGVLSGGNVQSQAGITPIPMITDGSVFVDVVSGIGRNVGVAIANPGTAANVVTLTLRDQNGITAGVPVTLTLSANQQIARFVTELFPAGVIGTGFAGSLRLQSSTGIGVLGLRFSSNQFSTSPVGVTTNASSTTQAIVLPQFALGGGWATQLALVNNSGSTASGRVDIFDPTGNPMPVDLNNSTQSTFTYSIPAGGSLVLAPRDSNGQSPF